MSVKKIQLKGGFCSQMVKTKLTLAVMPKDDISPEKKVIGDVFLHTSIITKSIIKHSTGYFLLLNFPKGKFILTTGGTFYQQENFSIDFTSIDPKHPFIDLFLQPKTNYPFPDGMTIIRGKIIDSINMPVPGASIKVRGAISDYISQEDGSFFIRFNTKHKAKKSTLNIVKDGYKAKKLTVSLIIGKTIQAQTIQLTEK